mmetsp:Transcript_71792/g.164639  ORF Transcript_71792/g.164639 Transcript_71792/m.164639 type:complete len:403 (-) Transcript_71792:171-1379(-)
MKDVQVIFAAHRNRGVARPSPSRLYEGVDMSPLSLRDSLAHTARSSFISKMAVLLPSIHPLRSLLQFSVVASYKLRSILLVNTIWGTFMAMALYFRVSGEAVPSVAAEGCHKAALPLLHCVVISVISGVCASAFTLVLSCLQRRHIVYSADWSASRRFWILAWWRVLDVIFAVVSLVYFAGCVCFVGVFLAQVSPRDRDAFAIATMVVVVQCWVVAPITTSIVLAAAASAILSRSQWVAEVHDALGLPSDQGTAQPGDAGEQPPRPGAQLEDTGVEGHGSHRPVILEGLGQRASHPSSGGEDRGLDLAPAAPTLWTPSWALCYPQDSAEPDTSPPAPDRAPGVGDIFTTSWLDSRVLFCMSDIQEPLRSPIVSPARRCEIDQRARRELPTLLQPLPAKTTHV